MCSRSCVSLINWLETRNSQCKPFHTTIFHTYGVSEYNKDLGTSMKWWSLAMATKPWINLAHLRILTCIFERQGTKEHLQTLNLRICVVIISGLFMREGSLEMLSAQVHKSSQEAFSVNLAHPWPVFLAPELGAASLRFRKNTFQESWLIPEL